MRSIELWVRWSAAALLHTTAYFAFGAEGMTPEARLAAIDAVAPSVVRVQWHMRYDQGDAPTSCGQSARCSNCGAYHGSADVDYLTDEKRPYETAGFVLSDGRIVAPDPLIPGRFVTGITIRSADRTIDATVDAYAPAHVALFLQTDGAVEPAQPLALHTEDSGPYELITYAMTNGQWTFNCAPMAQSVIVKEDGRRCLPTQGIGVIVSSTGRPVSVCLRDYVRLGQPWTSPPESWQTIPADQLKSEIAQIEHIVQRGLVPVRLGFRSPRSTAADLQWMWSGEEPAQAEQWAQGMLIDEKTLVVLAGLEPHETARLERVDVYVAGQDPVAATFRCTLRAYDALIADLSEPVSGAVKLADEDIIEHTESMLVAADVELYNQRQVSHCRQTRIEGFDFGWMGRRYPTFADYADNSYVFRRDGALLAMPISRRERTLEAEDWYADETKITPMADLAPVLRDPQQHADPHNVPLPEGMENRLAWMGVELQPLDEELAMANQVSHLMPDYGGASLVTHVYENSPAAQAGIEQGFVLLWLEIAEYPSPLYIEVDEELGLEIAEVWQFGEGLLGEEVPPLWPAVNNSLTRGLTELGFGEKYTAVLSRNGEMMRKELTVAEGPAHYDSAPRFKSDDLGLTVRNLTYEVRRRFQRPADQPGIIVSKVEPGSKAAVAGLLPYEIITAVNDSPMTDVDSFEAAVNENAQLRLAVLRMSQGRIVGITKSGSAPEGQ